MGRLKDAARRHRFLVIIVLLNLLIWTPIFLQDGVILNRDFYFPLYKENFIEYHTSTWNSHASQANIEQIPRLFMRLPFIALAKLGMSVPVILKLLIVTTFLFISITAFLFLSQLLRSMHLRNAEFCAFLGAMLFAYNPASLQFIGGISLLFSLGTLPLTLYFALRYKETRAARHPVFAALTMLLSTGHPFILAINAGLLLIFLLLMLPWRQAARFFAISMALSLVLFSWFLLPYVSTGFVSETSLGRQNNLNPAVFDSISDNQVYKVLYLERDRFLYVNTFPEAGGVIPHNILHYLALVISLLLIFGLFLHRSTHRSDHRRVLQFAAAGFVLSTLISFGTRSFAGKAYYFIVTNAPLGWVFRSPLKFQLYQSFFFMILFAMAAYLLLQKVESKGSRAAAKCFAILLLIGICGYGAYDAATHTFSPVELPQQFTQVNNILDSLPAEHKVMWYPRYWEQQTPWSEGQRVSPFDMRSSKLPTYSTSLNPTWITDGLYLEPYRANAFADDSFYKNLSRLDVKYIAFHDDRNLTYDTTRARTIANHTTTLYAEDGWYLFQINQTPAGAIRIIARQDGSAAQAGTGAYEAGTDAHASSTGADANSTGTNAIGTDIPYDAQDASVFAYKYERISPTEWKIYANITSPATIILAETYDPLWQAQVKLENGTVMRLQPHLQYNAINGYDLNATGYVQVTISYTPQAWMRRGLVITLLAIALCIGFIIYDINRQKRSPPWLPEIEEI